MKKSLVLLFLIFLSLVSCFAKKNVIEITKEEESLYQKIRGIIWKKL